MLAKVLRVGSTGTKGTCSENFLTFSYDRNSEKSVMRVIESHHEGGFGAALWLSPDDDKRSE